MSRDPRTYRTEEDTEFHFTEDDLYFRKSGYHENAPCVKLYVSGDMAAEMFLDDIEALIEWLQTARRGP